MKYLIVDKTVFCLRQLVSNFIPLDRLSDFLNDLDTLDVKNIVIVSSDTHYVTLF